MTARTKFSALVHVECKDGESEWKMLTFLIYPKGRTNSIRYLAYLTDMEEKKQALAAIMAHYEPEKSFVFTDKQAQHVAVFRLDVAELTCKERS